MHVIFDAVPHEINIPIPKMYEQLHPLFREKPEFKPTLSDGNAHIYCTTKLSNCEKSQPAVFCLCDIMNSNSISKLSSPKICI